MSWLCSCGIRNSGLNAHCSLAKGWDYKTHNQISENTPDYLMYVVDKRWSKVVGNIVRELKGCKYPKCHNFELDAPHYCKPLCEERHKREGTMERLTEQEQKYTILYGKAKLFVQDMSIDELMDHIDQLEDIALTAKVNLRAASDRKREIDAQKKTKEWITTSEKPNQSVSDAIANVKVRQTRMSKLDKARAQLRAIGMDEDIIKEMMKNMEARATEKDVKTLTFKSPEGEITKDIIVVEKPTPEPSANEPFDASGLIFPSDTK